MIFMTEVLLISKSTHTSVFSIKLQIFSQCGYIGCHLQGGVQVPTGGKPQGKPTSLKGQIWCESKADGYSPDERRYTTGGLRFAIGLAVHFWL